MLRESSPVTIGHDFDGTVTNVWHKAGKFQLAASEILARQLRLPPIETIHRIRKNTELILSQPTIFGWEENWGNEKVIVAPAKADPYTLYKCAAQMLIEEERYSKSPPKTLPSTPRQTSDFLREVHSQAYKKVGFYFRDGAKEYIKELANNPRLNTVFITNSGPESVYKKLGILLGVSPDEVPNIIKVQPNAKKHLPDLSWTALPMYEYGLEGFPRRVLLRRPIYHDLLTSLGVQLVIGDIYELDHAVAEAIGKYTRRPPIYTILMTSKHSLSHEVAHFKNHPYGEPVDSLEKAYKAITNFRP